MSIRSIALSGLNAATQTLGVSAHNMANAQTAGFRRQTAAPQAQPEGGVTVTLGTASQPGASLASDLVQERVALHAFEANIATLRTADAMLGSLLDAHA